MAVFDLQNYVYKTVAIGTLTAISAKSQAHWRLPRANLPAYGHRCASNT